MPDLANEALRPLVRLNQIACDIETALQNDDLELMCQAADLLAPALRDALAHADAPASGLYSASEAAERALQAHTALRACEEKLVGAMEKAEAELNRLRQGKRAFSSRPPASERVGAQLDASR